MSYNKIKDEYGVVHATSPSWGGSGVVGTLCAYGLPEDDVLRTKELVSCNRCKLALGFLHEEADVLNKAITFARKEALFEGDLARRAGSPSPWAKLSMGEIEFVHRMAADLFHEAITNGLPIEVVMRAATRLESMRLEMAAFPHLFSRRNH